MKSETDAQPVVAATAMTPAEREEFEEFQRYRAWRAQQTAAPAATQVAAAQYPQQPQPQHLTMMQSYPQQHQQQVIMYPAAAIEARETRCCCSLVCALVNAAAWSGVFMVLGLITVGLGWSSGVYGTYYSIAPFMSIAPGLITLFPQLIIVGSSGAQAGCYRHCQGCSSGRPCFAGRPHGRKGCQLMTAFYVIGGVAFVMLCNTWVCLYGVGVYCGVTSLVQLIAHCLAFAATLKFLHEVKHPNPAQPPAAAAIPAGIHMQPVQQQYPPPPHLGHPEAVAQQVPYPVAQGV